MDSTWDCIVVGGGAAGLSAALVLGRARRRTLVVDAGRQSNLPSHGIGGLLGQDGRAPRDFYAAAHAELAAYPSVRVVRGEVVDGAVAEDGFVLELADGTRETARRVLLAIGMEHRPPALEGLDGLWGGSVFACPFCHGWEARERPLGVLDRDAATGAMRSTLLRAWTDDVTLLTDGPAGIAADEIERLAASGIRVDERPVSGLRSADGDLEAVAFADGSERRLGGLLVTATLHQRSDLAARLGAEVAPPTPVTTEAVLVDARFATSVPGLFAAGDVGATMPSVANAIAGGSSAAAMIVHGLTAELFGGAAATA